MRLKTREEIVKGNMQGDLRMAGLANMALDGFNFRVPIRYLGMEVDITRSHLFHGYDISVRGTTFVFTVMYNEYDAFRNRFMIGEVETSSPNYEPAKPAEETAGTPGNSALTCEHDYVNISLFREHLACRKCGKDKE
jgi:hypothetical protein